jgi:DNA-directed RNA polymerase
MAKITIKCIGDLFRDANNIKEWFAKSAKVVAHTGDSVKWVTPLGLPCVQPYKYMSPKNIISTVIQKVSIVNSMDEQPVNKSKQNSAFPPNFVHSLDSTHMMYTAIECYKRAIPFAAVHDSYWCHAANIETLGSILREKFIQLHSEPLTETLLENFQSRYPNEKFPALPLKGEFDLEEVKKSTYFFS